MGQLLAWYLDRDNEGWLVVGEMFRVSDRILPEAVSAGVAEAEMPAGQDESVPHV